MRAACILLLSAFVLGGCQKEPEPPPPPPPERVENASLGVAVAALPAGLKVAANEDGKLELATEDGTGKVWFMLGEIQNSINLVRAAEEHAASFGELPNGEHKRRVEMAHGDFGVVYLSGGRFDGEAGPEEESVLMLIHPWGDRMLWVRYEYPEGTKEEIQARLENHLFEVLNELEGLPFPDAAPADAAPADDVGESS